MERIRIASGVVWFKENTVGLEQCSSASLLLLPVSLAQHLGPVVRKATYSSSLRRPMAESILRQRRYTTFLNI
jgi:hypothetical protein